MKQVQSTDVDSDDEAVHTKARHVLRRLWSGEYNRYFADDVYRCPFCTTRRLASTDFNAVVTHAEAVKTSRPNVGASVNLYAYMAKHIALGIHLRNLQQVAIAEGRMPPIKPKAPKPKGYKFQKRMRAHAEMEARAAARRMG